MVQRPLRWGHMWTQTQTLLWDLALVRTGPTGPHLGWGVGEGSKLNAGISGSSARGGECGVALREPPEGASTVAQTVKNLPATQETQVQSLGREDPLEEGVATHSSIPAWRIPWTEETGHGPWGCKESDTTERLNTFFEGEGRSEREMGQD